MLNRFNAIFVKISQSNDMENETTDPQIIQPEDIASPEEQIATEETPTETPTEDMPAEEPAEEPTEETPTETPTEDMSAEKPAEEPEEPTPPTPPHTNSNDHSRTHRNPLTIIVLIAFSILAVSWIVRNCKGMNEEKKMKAEFRESFENRRQYAEPDSTYEEPDFGSDVDHGERPSIEVREQRAEEPEEGNDSTTTGSIVVSENAVPSENIETTPPAENVAPAENTETPAPQEDIPQQPTQTEE